MANYKTNNESAYIYSAIIKYSGIAYSESISNS
jgi:hypothetical protein